MKIAILLKFAVLGAALITGSAHAQLQTWQLTGNVYQQSGDFTPPSFAAVGQTVTIDYQFNTSTPFDPNSTSINNPVTSVTFDGQTSNVGSYFINLPPDYFFAINNWPTAPRSDGVNFMSWNLVNAPNNNPNSIAAFLNNFSTVASNYPYWSNLRLDFNNNGSVWLTPTSFVLVSAVPEPDTYAMLSAGLCLIGFVTRHKKALAQV